VIHPAVPQMGGFETFLTNFREHLPTFIHVVQLHILDDAQGGRGWLENASPLKMAVEELPLAPYGDLDR
jgi:hypothetical protein